LEDVGSTETLMFIQSGKSDEWLWNAPALATSRISDALKLF